MNREAPKGHDAASESVVKRSVCINRPGVFTPGACVQGLTLVSGDIYQVHEDGSSPISLGTSFDFSGGYRDDLQFVVQPGQKVEFDCDILSSAAENVDNCFVRLRDHVCPDESLVKYLRASWAAFMQAWRGDGASG